MTAGATPRQRQIWVDWLRALCIVGIVLYHTPPTLFSNEKVNFYITAMSFCLPCFFLASGLVYRGEKYPTLLAFVKHRVRQLLVPYFAFSLIFYTLWLVIGRRVATDDMAIAWWQPLVDMIAGKPSIVCAPLWFVTCLFTIQVIYYVIERLVPRRAVFVVSLAITLIYLTVSALLPDVDMHIDVWKLSDAIFFLPVYAAGNRFKQPLATWRPSTGNGIAAAVTAIAGFTLAYTALSAFYSAPATVGGHSLAPASFLDDRMPFFRLLAVFMILPLPVAVAKWCERLWGQRRLIVRIVSYGVLYLAMQNYGIGVYKIAATKLFGDTFIDNAYCLKYVVAPVLIAVITVIGIFLDRYYPAILGHTRPSTRR